MRGREKERERRQRDLEKKAREQADQCECYNVNYNKSRLSLTNSSSLDRFLMLCFLPVVALEEQRANLNRELSTLRHTHNKVRCRCFV